MATTRSTLWRQPWLTKWSEASARLRPSGRPLPDGAGSGGPHRPRVWDGEGPGLFGELWFLRVWLLPHGLQMVEHWVGPTGARDDFQWLAASIEAKTTTFIRGHIHRINGLDQLEPVEGGSLQLFSLRVRDEPAAANSLLSLVQGISSMLQEDPDRLGLFEERLTAAGYSQAQLAQYAEMHFRVVSERLYRVEGDFPRLLPESFAHGLPAGVERVEYEVNLEGLGSLLTATRPADFTPPNVDQKPEDRSS